MKVKEVIAFISGFICGVLASRLRKNYLRVPCSNEEETIGTSDSRGQKDEMILKRKEDRTI